MLYDMVGILVVAGLVELLSRVLSWRGLTDSRHRDYMGLWLIVGPVGLLAWLHQDGTLALVLPFTLAGIVRLLHRQRPKALATV